MGQDFNSQAPSPPPPPPPPGPSVPSYVPPPPPPAGWSGVTPSQHPVAGGDGVGYSPWLRRVWGYIVRAFSAYVVMIATSIIGGALGDVGAFVVLAGAVFSIAAFVRMMIQRGHLGYDVGDAAAKQTLVRDQTGMPMGSGWSVFGRAVAHILDALPCYLGFLWPLWDKQRQTFADKVVGTVVVSGSAHRHSAGDLWLNSLMFWRPVLKS